MTEFESWGLLSTGSTTRIGRTAPNRFAEVRNVKDFGAIGNNVHDDTSNIQAAFDALTTDKGGVYFPPGTYKVTGTINATANTPAAIVRGEGVISAINGSVNGPILKFDPGSGNISVGGATRVSNLSITNTHTSAGVGISFANLSNWLADHNWIAAFHAVEGWDAAQGAIIGGHVECYPGADAPVGSYGFCGTGNNAVIGLDCIGFDHGLRLFGHGHMVLGGRYELHRTGIMLGQDNTGANTQANALLLGGLTLEACQTHIRFENCADFKVTGVQILGGSVAPPGGSTNSHYGLDLNNALYGSIEGCFIGAWIDTAGVLVRSGSGTAITMIGIRSMVNGAAGGVDWSIDQSHDIQFINCNIPNVTTRTFSNKPASPSDGDLQLFTDSNTATFGATIAGSGSNRVIGRYSKNSSVWTVIALAT